MKNIIKGVIRRTDFDIVPYQPDKKQKPVNFRDLTDREIEIVESDKSYTLTAEETIVALLNAIRYITDHKISGDIAECGVWRGGSMMAVAQALMTYGDPSRLTRIFHKTLGRAESTL